MVPQQWVGMRVWTPGDADRSATGDQVTLAQLLNPWLSRHGPLGEYERYTIQTKAGPLLVHVYDDWVACRFDDVARAKIHFGYMPGVNSRLNPYSGKWNWHTWDVSTEPQSKKTFQRLINNLANRFMHEVEMILEPPKVTP